MDFLQSTNTVNMRIESAMDTTVFRNIRLPSVTKDLLPMTYSKYVPPHLTTFISPAFRSILEQSVSALSGSKAYSQCLISKNHISTFDKESYRW